MSGTGTPTRKPQPQPVGFLERKAREYLHSLHCSWTPCWPNSKVQIGEGDQRQRNIPAVNAQVHLPRGYFLLDLDGPDAADLFWGLVEDWPDSLLLNGRRGPRVLYRLPKNVWLGRGSGKLPDLDVLTERFMAPGSTVSGHYYNVMDLREVATPPAHEVRNLAEVLGIDPSARPSSRSGLSFTMRDADRFSPTNRDLRRQRVSAAAADRAQRRRRSAAVTGDAAQRRAHWLHETRVGERDRAIFRVALQMQRFGEPFDEFVDLVLAHPVKVALRGHGVTRTRLAYVWNNAGRSIAYSNGEARRPTSAAMLERVEQQAELAVVWGLQARETILGNYSAAAARRRHMLNLIDLHASWIARFGVNYYLAWRPMRLYLGLRSNRTLQEDVLRPLDVEHALLRRRLASDRTAEDAMRWDALIDKTPIRELSSTRLRSSSPADGLRLLSVNEMDALLVEARRLEEEVERPKRGTGHRVPKLLRQPSQQARR